MLSFKSFREEIVAPIIALPKYFEHDLSEELSDKLKEQLAKESRGVMLKHHDLSKEEHEAITKKLSAHFKDIGKEDKEHIHKYTSGYSSRGGSPISRDLNKNLKGGKDLTDEQHKIHSAILNNAKPSKHEVHLYSGVRAKKDIDKLLSDTKKGKPILSKSHISASHDPKIGYSFTRKGYLGSTGHMIHIHVKPKDKILHVSHLAETPTERETILPAGTKLKYSHTDTHIGQHPDNPARADEPFHVHHFTVHHD